MKYKKKSLKIITKLVILFFYTCLTASGSCQDALTIQTRIIDSNGQGVAYATVELLSSIDTLSVKNEISDDDGKVVFTNISTGSYLLRVSYLGMKTWMTPIFSAENFNQIYTYPNIVLKESDNRLNEVTVVAKKPIIERKLDRLIVNVEASITSIGSSALEVLGKCPGVMINQESSINLKGKQGVIIMIDGRPTPLSGSDLINYLKSLPSDHIERIEIIANPSAKYDASGNGGIIDIKLKKSNKEGFNGNATLNVGQGSYFKPSVSMNNNYRYKKFNFYDSYSYSRPSGYTKFYINRKFFGPQRIVSSIFDQSSFIKQTFDNHNVKLGIDYYASKSTVIGIMTNGNWFTNIRNGNTDSYITDHLDIPIYSTKTANVLDNNKSNLFFNFNLKQILDSLGKELTMDIDYGSYRSKADQNFSNNYFDPFNNLLDNNSIYTYQEGSIKVKSIKIDYSNPLKNGSKLEAGLKSSIVNTDNDISFYNVINQFNVLDTSNSNNFLYEEKINAAYLNYLIERKKLDFQFGLRLEQSITNGHQIVTDEKFNRKYLLLFPSGVVNYKINDNHQLSFSYSRRIDRPSYNQLNPFRIFVDPYTYVVGDPSLKPVLTNALELAHTWKGRYSTTLNFSRSKETITDVFSQDDVSKISYQVPANIQDADIWYLSTSIPFDIGKWCNNMLVPSFYWSKYSSPLQGGDLINQSFSWDLNLQNNFNWGTNGWSAEINSFYQSRNVWGQFIIKALGQVTVGIQKVSKDKLSTVKFSLSDVFKTNHIAVVVDYLNQDFHTERTWDSRAATLSLTYRFGKKTVERSRQRTTGIEEEKKRSS